MTRGSALLAGLALLALGGAAAVPAGAETTATAQATRAAAGEAAPESAAAILEERRRQTLADIEALSAKITLTDEKRAALKAEIAALSKDEAAIGAALLQAAKSERKLADEIAGLRATLVALGEETTTIRLSLRARSAVLAEVLAALQRLGLNPPPALLVTPQDALASVRSAVLLGAVVPAMRIETLALKADLERLVAIADETRASTSALESKRAAQVAERGRLDLLLQEKRDSGVKSAEALAAEERQAKEIARGVKDLQALLAAIDRKIEDVRSAADARRNTIDTARENGSGLAPLGPSVSFASLRGTLPPPVSGIRVLAFGQASAAGVVSGGDTFQTRSGAIVTAPADAIVAFAAPFRSYGQLVILDAGDGYRMVIAGLAKLGVRTGQTVLAGEPLGTMADSAPAAPDAPEPQVYVELRKDGQAIDPAAWWQTLTSGLQSDDT